MTTYNIISAEDFTNYLAVKQLSPKTINEYLRYFRLHDPNILSQDEARKFLLKYKNQVARAYLKNLITFIKTNDFPEERKQAMIRIELSKVSGSRKKRLPNIISENDLFAIEKTFNSERDRLMLLIAFYGGLRESELCGNTIYAIKPFSFQWRKWIEDPSLSGQLRVIGKGNKERIVLIPQRIMARLYQYIKAIASQRNREAPIFDISPRRWRAIVYTGSIKAIGRRIHPHLLRHSCSIWLKQKGFDLYERGQYLGHSSVITTSIYDRVDLSAISKKFDAALKIELDQPSYKIQSLASNP